MDLLDRPARSPAEDTLVQSQFVLFAAALFIGCTIFDVHSAKIDVARLLAKPAAMASRNAAPASKPASTAPAVAARSEGKRMSFRSASLQSATRSAAACLRSAPEGTPAPALLALLD